MGPLLRGPLYTGPRCEHPVNAPGRTFCERPAGQSRPGSGRTGNCFWFCVDHADQYDREHPSAEEKHEPPKVDRDEIRSELRVLALAADDIHALVLDMLRPLRRRELGPALHRENYDDARTRITGALAAVLRIVSADDGPADPSGGSTTH